MKRFLLATALLSSTLLSAQVYDANYPFQKELLPPQSSVEVINRVELRKHLTFIASDELRGRDTGSPELDIAARYLASHLESYGYRGIGPNGSFFQEVPLHKAQYDLAGFKLALGKKPLVFELGKEAAVLGMGTDSFDFTAGLVYVGEGVYNDSLKHYTPEQVNGKVVIRTPLKGALAARARVDQAYTHQTLRNTLFKHGAKAVVFVVDDADAAAQMIRIYHTFAGQSSMSMTKSAQMGPYLILNADAYQKLLQTAKITPAQLAKTDGKPVFKENLSLTLRSSYQLIKTRNVVAVLDGSDPVLKNEYVGFGAHYDHVGAQDTLIFNGADDDGSGTVGVLNIAQAFAASRPKRSIFINFHTGEEKGLLGSAFFADNALLPLENLVAMVNIDMIGSDYQNERVHVVGADRISRELHDINELVNQARSGMVLDYTFNDDKHPEQIYYRSDHYNYAKKGVPVIFYTNENPKHYHKHTDEVSTINFDKLERIARLAYQTGFYVANKADRLKINPPVESK
jgi:hypothetical protein